jgi:hypothetical protein
MESTQSYYEKNKEKLMEYGRKYYLNNKDKFKEYYNRNHDYRSNYYQEHREQLIKYQKQYYRDNKERYRHSYLKLKRNKIEKALAENQRKADEYRKQLLFNNSPM